MWAARPLIFTKFSHSAQPRKKIDETIPSLGKEEGAVLINRFQMRWSWVLFLSVNILTCALGSPIGLGEEEGSGDPSTPGQKYQVLDLPGLANVPEELRPVMHAGHIALDPSDVANSTKLFFWKFQKQDVEFNRTIFWLNGGPGCSSMDGALMETGPLRVDGSGNLNINTGSWYEGADLIFVDQPGGTGFSTTKNYDTELSQIAADFVTFLTEYFKVFPEDKDNAIFLAGESYAGQYIPFIADAILRSNKVDGSGFNLEGLLIGNGWIDPNVQSMSYIPYLLDAEIIHPDDDFIPSLLKQQEKCQNDVNNGIGKEKFYVNSCDLILSKILSATRDKTKPKDEQCINMYDTRLRDSYPSCGMNWPPDLPNVQKWLRDVAVVKALNLDPNDVAEWRECDGQVSKYLKNRESKPSIELLPGLLEQLNVVLFNGDKDIICNNYGVLDLISKMTWNGALGFDDDAEEFDWRYNGLSTGTVKHSRNLTFIDIFDSSHMVPFDKPEDSRGVFDLIVGNYRLIESANETFVETPVYQNNALIWPSEGNKSADDNDDSGGDDSNPPAQHKSIFPFILYLLFIVIVGAIILHFRGHKAPNKNSILRTTAGNNKKSSVKKTVSWADDNAEDSSAQSATKSGKFGEFFNNYTTQKKGYKAPGSHDDDYEDIELQEHDDASFDLDRELESDRSNMV